LHGKWNGDDAVDDDDDEPVMNRCSTDAAQMNEWNAE
jgi:hypothetical protein